MNPVLELRDISKIYGSGHTAVTAVDSASLEVSPGEIVLVMGPSGSGKTTMLSMAGLLLKPTRGAIRINGINTQTASQKRLARLRLEQLGFIFQAYNLLGALTARENVEVVMNLAGKHGKAARQRAIELLTLLGLGHRLDHLPSDLSGGEKQRVAIARALANEAPLILADEPTGNLDSKSGKEVMQLLREKLADEDGKAIVVVTHDHRLKEIADRILWLEDGVLSPTNGDLQSAVKH
jgi:putative ABC transport system ATP-binding protein